MRTLLFCFALAVAASACGGSDEDTNGACDAGSAAATATVNLQGNSFDPNCVKVAQGTLVTFNNQDATDHTVTTDSGQPETFDSGVIAGGGSFTHTFNVTGSIAVHCGIHGSMHATVIVE